MLNKVFSIHRKQKGFTLVELLIALAITAVIGSAIVITISQLFTVSIADKNRMEAVKQVENALHYINRDVQMARAGEITPANGSVTLFTSDLSLQWTDYTAPSSPVNTVVYHLDSNGNLQREHTIGTDPPIITKAATHIVSADSNYSFDSVMLTVNLTASVEGYRSATETRSLQVKPRIN